MIQKGFSIPTILLVVVILMITFIVGNRAPKLEFSNIQPASKTSQTTNQEAVQNQRDEFSAIPNIEPVLLPYLTADHKLWYQFEYAIYNSNLDGTNAKKILEGTQFDQLSAVGLSKDGNTIYYVTIPDQNKVALFKKNLQDSSVEKLLEVEKSGMSGLYYRDFAISKSEQFVAYDDKEGLWIYDLAKHTKRLLLANKSFENTIAGYSYHSPIWSYDDSRIAVTKNLWEGATNSIIEVNTGKIVAENLISGNKSWSFKSNQLLIAGYSYGNGGLFLVKEKPTNLLENNLDLKDTPVFSGKISSNDKIIFLASQNIGLFNTQDNTYKTLLKGYPKDQLDFLWLPDDKYVYFRNETSDVWFVRVDSPAKIKLPIQADRLISVI